MSLKTYIAQDQETIYDLAIRLYKDARGINDILLLNPSLDLNAATYFGAQIVYDDAILYKREVFVTVAAKPPREPWSVHAFQTVYDLCLQIYGDISSLPKILANFNSLDDPEFKTIVPTEYTDNFLANALFSQKIVATSNGDTLSLDAYWQWESEDVVQWESGAYIDLE